MNNINIPTNNYLNMKKRDPRKKAESAIDDFKKLLDDKTHPDNQTEGYKNNVISILNNLLVSANEMDEVNPGEGIFSLIVLSLRCSLKLRDRCNSLEVENRELKNKIKKINRTS